MARNGHAETSLRQRIEEAFEARPFSGRQRYGTGRNLEADLEQTRLMELMARRSETVHVLAHAAKLGRRSPSLNVAAPDG